MATNGAAAIHSGNAYLEGAEVWELFPSSLYRYRWVESGSLNAELRETILKRMQRSRGVNVSNLGGWHSDNDLPTWSEPCVRVLLGRIESFMKEIVIRTVDDPRAGHLDGWRIEAWANVSRRGARNRSHNHVVDDNLWSGIYYVDPGDIGDADSVGGWARFEDRQGVPKEILNDPDPYEREVGIQPCAGLMVIFPGTLFHRVEPYYGDRERISVAFNLRHSGFVVPDYSGHAPRTLNRWMWRNFRGLMLSGRYVKRQLGIARTSGAASAWPLAAATCAEAEGSGDL